MRFFGVIVFVSHQVVPVLDGGWDGLRRYELAMSRSNFEYFRVFCVKPDMKKIMVALVALGLLTMVVPQADAGQRHRRNNHRGHAISSHHGHHRTVVRHGHRRAYSNQYYGRRAYRSNYYRNSYYDPYYGGYSPYYGGGYAPYAYGFPGIALSFGGGHHHHGGHH
jgi:hypothetical protein